MHPSCKKCASQYASRQDMARKLEEVKKKCLKEHDPRKDSNRDHVSFEPPGKTIASPPARIRASSAGRRNTTQRHSQCLTNFSPRTMRVHVDTVNQGSGTSHKSLKAIALSLPSASYFGHRLSIQLSFATSGIFTAIRAPQFSFHEF